ncbi:MAG TPA: hypothetical protein VM536_15395 [Chloroflexia bacterium]|nr:hypothetical protein [Chloroflexia bacterium]
MIDFDVHGLLTIRLRNAPRPLVDSVAYELGLRPGVGSGPADLTITCMDRLPEAGPLRLLGLHQAGFDAQHFYLFDAAGRRARIDFAGLGGGTEILCESGLRHVPLLIPLVALHLLGTGHVLLHASSFVFRGQGVLVTGWQKGGKTEMLLPFMAAGADYIADEWTIVGGRPPALYGLARVARLWEWHFQYLPAAYWARIGRASRIRLGLMRLYRQLYRAGPGRAGLRRGPFRALQRLSREGGTWLQGVDQLAPGVVFPGHVHAGPAPLDRGFLAVLGQDGTHVAPEDPAAIAARMVSSLAYERSSLWTAYQQYRFAFPDRRSPLIEGAREQELAILTDALAGKPAFEIVHPYPVPLSDLYAAAAPYF